MSAPVHPGEAGRTLTNTLPAEAVMLLRFPLTADNLMVAVTAAEKIYGKGLVIRTDVPAADGWMVIARPSVEDKADAA